jgi:hypothetical protein
MLAQKTHLALAILLHLLQLILNQDGLINQMLKIWVVGVEQLKLDLILETLEKRILLLLLETLEKRILLLLMRNVSLDS